MHLDIDGSSLVRRVGMRRHIETEIARRLGPFAGRVSIVRIRVRERAPSEPTRTMCGIALALDSLDGTPGRWVLGRAEDDDACRAVDRAVERVAQTVGEEVARCDQEQARRAYNVHVLSQAGIAQQV